MSRRTWRLLVVPVVAAAAAPIAAVATPVTPLPAARDLGARMATSAPPASVAAAAYRRMTPDQRIGQLFLVGIDSAAPTAKQRAVVERYDVGNLFLVKNSGAGTTATRQMVSGITPAATAAGVSPLVGTDQEGGYVQRLTGTGFATIPTALQQGAWATSTLTSRAKVWGRQLRHAGVDLNAAPVADVVPARDAHANAPIGRYDREYGHRPGPVAGHVTAFLRGMRASGVVTTVKHFPGLGRATGNTDTARGVTDPTTRHDRFLRPFQSAIKAGVPIVMVSSARYPAIDPHHIAAFSRTIIGGVLRGDLGFTGVVVSDSLTVPPLDSIPPGTRALRFLQAGGDVLLLPEVHVVAQMRAAIAARIADSSRFARQVKAAVMTVLRLKAEAGLISSNPGS